LLGPQTAFTGGLGRLRGAARAVNAESIVETFRQAVQRQLAVASLGTFIAHDNPHS